MCIYIRIIVSIYIYIIAIINTQTVSKANKKYKKRRAIQALMKMVRVEVFVSASKVK